ncbi:MAG TPA: glycosyltransferase family 87 protein [Rhodopila sp.]|nr:glycosyltransferase family 87 protein [Rhodopila sp.]
MAVGDRSRRLDWLLTWRLAERKTIYLIAISLFGALCFVAVSILSSLRSWHAMAPGQPLVFGDFRALWTYGKIAAAHPGIELYDWNLLHDRQVALRMKQDEAAPFPYAPPFIAAFRVLSILPFVWSYFAFAAASLLLFAWVGAKTISGKPWSLIAVAVAPVSTIAVLAGQTGFVAAALLTGGLRLSRSNPLLSGIALGLLCYKPQLGVLVPVGLVAVGAWRAIGVAVLTITALAAAATWRFGWQVWAAWLSMMPRYDAFFFGMRKTLPIQPTVLANLRLLGCPYALAQAVQAGVALVVAVMVWRVHRRGSDRIAHAALIVGTFLATPHAFIYDMPVLAAAMCLFIQDRIACGGAFTLAEIGVLTLGSFFPVYIVAERPDIPVSSVCLILLFAMLVRRANGRLGTGQQGEGATRPHRYPVRQTSISA